MTSLNAGVLTFNPSGSATITGSDLVDNSTAAGVTAATVGAAGSATVNTITLAGASDTTAGDVTLNGAHVALTGNLTTDAGLAAVTATDSFKTGVNGDQLVLIGAQAIANDATPLVDTTTVTSTIAAPLSESPTVVAGNTLGSLTAASTSDVLSGAFTIQSGATAGSTPTSVNFSGNLAQIADQINQGGYGITASLNTAANSLAGTAAGTVLTFTQTASDAGIATITNNGVILDTTAQVTNAAVNVSNPNSSIGNDGSGGAVTTNLGTLIVANKNDILSGSINLTESTDTLETQTPVNVTGLTLQEVANEFNSVNGGQYANLGISAAVNSSVYTSGGVTYAAGTILTFTQNNVGGGGAGTAAVSGTALGDSTPQATTNETVAAGTMLNSFTVANSTDTLSGDIMLTSGASATGTSTAYAITPGQTLQQIANNFNTTAGTDSATLINGIAVDAQGIYASVSGNTITFSQMAGDKGTASVATDTNHASTLVDTSATASTTQNYNNIGTVLNTLTATTSSDKLTGTLNIQEGADTNKTASTYNLNGQTVAQVAAAFNTGSEKNLGITATVSGTNNNILTFSQTQGDLGTANVTNSTAIQDLLVQNGVSPTSTNVTVAAGTMLDTLSVNNKSDALSGTLNLTSGLNNAPVAIKLGTTGSTDTLANLAASFASGGANAGYGIAATLNAAQTQITFTQNSGDGFAASVSIAGTDTGSISLAASTNLGSLTATTATDTMTGTLKGIGADGKTAYQISLNGETLSEVLQAVNSNATAGITATLNKAGTGLSFAADSADSGTPTIGNYGNITDTSVSTQTAVSITSVPTSGVANSSTLGSVSISSLDTLSGSMTIGGQTINIGSSDNTAASLASTIDKGNYGVQAAYNANSGQLTFTSPNSAMGISTSSLNETAPGTTTSTAVGSLTGAYTSSGYYSRGVTGTVTDTSTHGGTQAVGITANANGSGGIATMSYKDGAGQSLSATDLSNQSDAQTALTDLNKGITDVAAQDGYIGAQINTLNSVSSVLGTQQQNVVAAQNAVQATDYASATSNMSKYEILSQTGIAALAQANSLSQEVTKLLQ